ncbi:MAG: DUF5665 domain-containing protein [Peptostreptococcaceae bacterium]
MKFDENRELNDDYIINMKELDDAINEYSKTQNSEDIKLIKRYLERMILIIERSRIRDYMMLTDSKRRLFMINFISGLGKGFGQAIGFTFLAAIALYIVTSWVNLPIIGEYIADIMNIVEQYRNK